MKAKLLLSSLVVLNLIAISNATIVTDIYEDETVNHADYEILEIHDSLDVPPEQTTVTFVAGSGAYGIHSNDTSIVNLYGGTFGNLTLRDSSTMNLYGGVINAVNGIQAGSTLNVFGTDFSEYVDNGRVFLSGTWEDGSSFSFFFDRKLTIPSNVELHQVPEPTAIALLGLGVLVIKKEQLHNCKGERP